MGGDHNSCGCVPHHLPSRLEKAWQKHTWVGGQKGPHGGPGLYLNVPFALTQHTLHSTPHLQLPLPMKETNVPFGMENMGSYMLFLSLSIHPSTSLDRSLFERGLRLRVNYTIIAFFGGYVDLKRLSLSLYNSRPYNIDLPRTGSVHIYRSIFRITCITLFKSITQFFGIDNLLHNISHISN